MKSKLMMLILTALLSGTTLAQTISNINPDQGNAGTTLNVTITGANTHFTQATNTTVGFFFSGASATATFPNYINTVNSQTLTANLSIPSGTPDGWYDFAVWNSLDGFMLRQNGFKVIGPGIQSITPNEGKAGTTLDVTITGANTHFMQATSTAVRFYFSGATPTATYPNYIQKINDITIDANLTIPASTPEGWYNMSVTNEIDGYLFKPSFFQVKTDIGIASPASPGEIFSVYPNPFRENITLSIPNAGQEDVIIRIFNTEGLLMDKRTCTLSSGNKEIPLRLSLDQGIYYLVINRPDGRSHAAKIIRLQ